MASKTRPIVTSQESNSTIREWLYRVPARSPSGPADGGALGVDLSDHLVFGVTTGAVFAALTREAP